jgi:hypothetical protein
VILALPGTGGGPMAVCIHVFTMYRCAKGVRRRTGLESGLVVQNSYRVAQIQNVAQVSLEAGNSPRVVFSNYRELVRPVGAGGWKRKRSFLRACPAGGLEAWVVRSDRL